MKRFFTLTIFLIILIQCKSDPKEQSAIQKPVAESNSLPPIPLEQFNKIYNESTNVDYSFYEYPFSMSYDNQSSIRSVLKWVGKDAPNVLPGCKAICRMIFLKDGNIIIEAELYISDMCAHYIWYVDGEKKYSNLMAVQGKQHYTQIISQFNK